MNKCLTGNFTALCNQIHATYLSNPTRNVTALESRPRLGKTCTSYCSLAAGVQVLCNHKFCYRSLDHRFSQHQISFPLFADIWCICRKIQVSLFVFLCVCINYILIMKKCCSLVDSVQAWEPGMLGEVIAKL